MAADAPEKKEGQIPTNLRLLVLLEEVARRGVAVKPAEMIEAMGLPKPTVHRLMQTAEAEGFLQRDLDGRAYGPGPRLRKLALATMSSEHLSTARLIILKGVAEELGETCNLAIPDREGMLYLDRVETKWPLRIQLPIGTQVPFHCTASGKMYLSTLKPSTRVAVLRARTLEALTGQTCTDPDALSAELETIESRDYSTDDEEFIAGMAAVAVPVRDARNRLLATLSVHAPVQRRSLSELMEFLPSLQKGARALGKLI
ncbi:MULTISPECIES: IclR family transcriptional regulator [unclassified Leisingera]|uniref:IclR family transcriptional regulator n=1 Tax=unclassified Leisingera TaxID=2614906 RepID=UPI0002F10BC2|nr:MULTISPECIES: IclR family transcriptional regulator [unclassified Leisingera]KIC17390.1 ArsR family transcriptional regulator [Leisingera sp. ANG-DT]KIC23612.1 ArsR family transcriptional regulator [Leisingera sp. ANG-S3]KIC32262.1 ArsR family transcriptional regulator [Leisingera sp. ANG-S5]KIC52183.1 ArsR family transcriptional regulator [Leisingera sp. ANG-S]KID09741.1 ArsR family transcriptional regulator [Leisingera sp. ANG1]